MKHAINCLSSCGSLLVFRKAVHGTCNQILPFCDRAWSWFIIIIVRDNFCDSGRGGIGSSSLRRKTDSMQIEFCAGNVILHSRSNVMTPSVTSTWKETRFHRVLFVFQIRSVKQKWGWPGASVSGCYPCLNLRFKAHAITQSWPDIMTPCVRFQYIKGDQWSIFMEIST